MTNILSRFAKDESGATAIEYGLIAAIVGVGIIAGLGNLKDGLNTVFGDIQGKLEGAGGEAE
jgi:pilus assembly protein Flp/PilA